MKKNLLLFFAFFCFHSFANLSSKCQKVDKAVGVSDDETTEIIRKEVLKKLTDSQATEIVKKGTPGKITVTVFPPASAQPQTPTALPLGVSGYKLESYVGQGGMGKIFYVSSIAHPERKFILKIPTGKSKKEVAEREEALQKEYYVNRKIFPNDSSIELKKFYNQDSDMYFHGLQIPAFMESNNSGEGKLAKSMFARSLGAELKPEDRYVVFASEYKPSDEKEKAKLKAQSDGIISLLLDATQKMHEKGVIHGDIKPENTLIRIDEHGNPEILDIDWAFASVKKEGETSWKLAFDESAYGTPKFADYEAISAHEPTERRDTFARGLSIEKILGHHLNAPQRLLLKLGFASNTLHLKKFFEAAGELPTAKAYQEIAKNWATEIRYMLSTTGKDKFYYNQYSKFLIARLLDAGEGRVEVIKALKEIAPELIPIIKKQSEEMKQWVEGVRLVMKDYKKWREEVIKLPGLDGEPPESPEKQFESQNPFHWSVLNYNRWWTQYITWSKKAKNSQVRKVNMDIPYQNFDTFFQVFPPTEESSKRLSALNQELSGI